MSIEIGNVSDTDKYQTALTEGLKSSVLEMLGMMAMAEVAYTGHKELDRFSVSGPATGLMVMTGQHRTVVAICMPDALLRDFVAGITGITPDALTAQDLGDGIGEMINMICGGMKTKLASSDMELLPPMTVIGGDYAADWKTDQKTIALEFETESGAFAVYACTL